MISHLLEKAVGVFFLVAHCVASFLLSVTLGVFVMG